LAEVREISVVLLHLDDIPVAWRRLTEALVVAELRQVALKRGIYARELVSPIRENPSDPWLKQMVPSRETARSGGEKIAVNCHYSALFCVISC
jgi:hypothetical protein